jgi:hypothetical protein
MKDVEEAARLEDPNTKSIARTLVVQTTVVQVTTTNAASTATAATQSMPGLMLNVVRFMHGSDPSNVKDLSTNVKDLSTNVWDQCHHKA